MSYSGYTVEEIEDAIVTTLKADTTLDNYVRTIDRLPWERAEELDRLVKLYPALLVAYSGGSDDNSASDIIHHVGRFVVLCCAKNLRSPSSALRGPESGEKGVYDLLHDVLSCLHLSTLDLDIVLCESVRVTPVAASARLAVFSREFEITWGLLSA